MKTLITILLLTLNLGMAQPEPDIDKVELIDKVDRSELEAINKEDLNLDDTIPKFEMPKLEFKKDLKPTKSRRVSKKTITSNKPPSRIQEAKPKTVEKPKDTVKGKKLKMVYAKRPISLNQIKINDKVVFISGKTFIHRLQKSYIIQYKLNEKIPLMSEGIKVSDSNSYRVINPKKLIEDTKAIKIKTMKAPVLKPKTPIKKQITSTKTIKPIVEQDTSSQTAKNRKIIELKYNRGKEIKKSIQLKNLRTNDNIYIVGDLQFVIRASKSTSAKNKYWLTESIDESNSALERKGKNKFKVLRSYRTK